MTVQGGPCLKTLPAGSGTESEWDKGYFTEKTRIPARTSVTITILLINDSKPLVTFFVFPEIRTTSPEPPPLPLALHPNLIRKFYNTPIQTPGPRPVNLLRPPNSP
ncbi:hypothetical protein DSO57_1023337 [Entomophthora muscae]|uniref:Uncharacterized protein n=1 Tax=Entomophthora muscae TaxID=34485 RepID=A0ACC2UMU1_9FUNG|nr:hypothetical protein DSO57_1023337 [Entomophthora muscae]